MKKLVSVIFVATFAIAIATTAQAVPLAPGGSVLATGAASPGGLLLASISVPYATTGNLAHGTFMQWVRDTGSGLVFEYQFTNDADSPNPITQMATQFFGGFTTDVDGFPLQPDPFTNGISRTSGAGNSLTFAYFTNSVDPGQTSQLLWVKTNAQFYNFSGFTGLLGGGTADITAFQPTIPEPASAMLLGLGIIGFAGSIIRRKFMA